MDDQNGRNPKDPVSTQVRPNATRRTFTRDYKLAIVREAAECRQSGAIGALLRREGLYSSALVAWRREFDGWPAGAPLEARRRGPKPRLSAQEKHNLKLERENQRLRKKLALTEALLDLQKKTLVMLESLDPKEDGES
jgi:transposase-like protein